MSGISSIQPFVYPPQLDPGAGLSPHLASVEGPAKLATPLHLPPAGITTPAGSFSNVLDKLVTGVMEKQQTAQSAMSKLLSGQDVPLHQVVLEGEEASIAFQLMVEIRNKLLESYQELMRMQV